MGAGQEWKLDRLLFRAQLRKNFFVVADIENGRSEYQIVPIDLDMHNDDYLLRGLQKLVECEVGREFSGGISASNQKYGTKFRYDKEKKAISFYL